MKGSSNENCMYSISNEIQKRIDKIEKNNIKINTEGLAKETKNLLIRMPIYEDGIEEFDTIYNDTKFSNMMVNYLFTEGFVDKWKNS